MSTRELKFRTWDTENKEWCAVDMSYSDNRHGPISTPVVFNGQNKCIIMQYTGLKDKNGTEIYEGDILKNIVLDHETEDSQDIQEVTYDIVAGQSGFSLPWPIQEYKVIGNIYENPELLK